MSERLKNATQILNYAKQHNTSINQACTIFNRGTAYVRDTRLDYKDRNSEEFQEFLSLYNSVLKKEDNPSIQAPVTQTETDEELGLLSKDTVIKKEVVLKTETSNTLELDFRGNKIIKSADDLIERANIDFNVWKLDRKVVNSWSVTMKQKDRATGRVTPITAPNYQVKIWLSKLRSDDQQKAFERFLESIRENAPKSLSKISGIPLREKGAKKYLLELSLPDLHIGKLSWEDESGENYDTKIAIQRYNESVAKLLDHVRHYKNEIDEIILPIGNDLFNIDNKHNTTTAGTPQHVDSRWQQMFYKAKELMIKNINDLMQIAPVKVIMVSGNHDQQTVFYLGSVLEAYYRNTNNVTVDNSPVQRKYHRYGVNFIGFTHGNEEKHQELGLIMATERAEDWAATKCRQFHLGHFHSRRTTKYLDVQEFQGFTVRILPSLSGTDAWHNSKGYMSMKSGVAYLYEKENGLVAEFSHNII